MSPKRYVRSLWLVAALLGVGGCSVLVGLDTPDACEGTEPRCDGNTLVQCEEGFVVTTVCDAEEVCDDVQGACVLVNVVCGDGQTQGSEQCDDGNNTSGDGCDSNCTVTACGNGIPTEGEECDDGNLTSGDGCDSQCFVEIPLTCGNGVIDPPEQCDDANQINGDGCDNNCTVTACGNGIPTEGEECDDGNLENNDSCSAQCRTAFCGNGIVDPGEVCDGVNAGCGNGRVCTNGCQTCFNLSGD